MVLLTEDEDFFDDEDDNDEEDNDRLGVKLILAQMLIDAGAEVNLQDLVRVGAS